MPHGSYESGVECTVSGTGGLIRQNVWGVANESTKATQAEVNVGSR